MQGTQARHKTVYNRLQSFMACACMPTLAKAAPLTPPATATLREMLAARRNGMETSAWIGTRLKS